LVAVVVLPFAGCGGQSQASSSGTVVGVSEKDFAISAPHEVAAGNVDLRVHNHGPDQHELIVVRMGASAMPLRKDGITVDEDAIMSREAGALEPGAPGAVRDLQLHLNPGRYVLFCNMYGHCMAGMDRTLVVKG